MKQPFKTDLYLITPDAGKRLIAKAIAANERVQRAITEHTVVVLAGTTNGFVAEELLAGIGRGKDFSRRGFNRGLSLAPGRPLELGAGAAELFDVVIHKGQYVRGKTIFDVAGDLKKGDIVLKGANAVDAERVQAGVLIGHPAIGTLAPVLQAAVGRRAELMIPVGLEKRVFGSLGRIAGMLNAPESSGPRMMAISGTIVTEIEALEWLCGAGAELAAAGGAYGAQGSVYLAVRGTDEQMESAAALLREVQREPLVLE